MDLKDKILNLRDQVTTCKENAKTEEATKNALIMPFIQLLGYNVFDPTEVIPEMICDIGTKKGEKVDYAIMKDGKPIMLMECKHWDQELSAHNIQLKRYYQDSDAKFGVLTNGITYQFFTDLVKPNVMDDVPFLEFNIEEAEDDKINELSKFYKEKFDAEVISSSAKDLKYMSKLKALIQQEYAFPSDDFVKLFAKQVYDPNKKITSSVIEEFRDKIKDSIEAHYKSILLDKFTQLTSTPDVSEDEVISESKTSDEESKEDEVVNKIITTTEELEGYYIVKSIVRNILPSERVSYRDAASYFSVVVDGRSRQPICRLYFNTSNKRVALLDEEKNEIRHTLSSLDDLYKFEDSLKEIATRYL